MSETTQNIEAVRDAFSTMETALIALGPDARANLSPSQLAKFRQARRGIKQAHILLAEIAEEINQGPQGEIVTLGSGS